MSVFFFFFFKQKTAYEMRISDWSSDVCSSDLNEIFFRDLGIRAPDCYLDAAGATAAETIGNVIIAADALFAEERPDAILILGDTNSALAAIPAKRRRIPIFHMEAGNRCRSEEHTSELQSLMRISYDVFCLK